MQFKTHDDQSITLTQIKDVCKQSTQDIVYYFVENTKEDHLNKLKEAAQGLGRSVYIDKLALGDKIKFVYSVHII